MTDHQVELAGVRYSLMVRGEMVTFRRLTAAGRWRRVSEKHLAEYAKCKQAFQPYIDVARREFLSRPFAPPNALQQLIATAKS
ncbi:hypothetical protein [Rhizobium sp.]